jgi:F-type H+-transporting ATPase subunit alpha
VNVGISVSRVGGAAQTKAMKSVAGRLRLDLAQYRELEAFASFASDLDAATKRQLERGARTVEVLKQGQYQPMSVENQVTTLYAVTNGHLDDVPVNQIREWERGFHDYLHAQFPQISQGIRKEKALSKELEADLKRAITQYKEIASSAARAAAPARPAAAAARSK